MNKKIALAAIVALLIIGMFLLKTITSSQTIHLKGKLSEKVGDEFVIKYKGLLSEVSSTKDIILKLDEKNSFDTVVTLTSSGYYNVFEEYGTGTNLLYLSPGDDLDIYFQLDNGTQTKYNGTGAEANRYLADFQLYFYGDKAHSFLNGGRNAKSTFELTKGFVDSLAASKINTLNTTKELSDEFRKVERSRIFAHLANSYLHYFYSQDGIYSRGNIEKEHQQYLMKIKPEIENISKEFMNDISIEHPDVRRVVKKCAVDDNLLSVSVGSNVYDYASLLTMKDLLVENRSQEATIKATNILATFKSKDLADNLAAAIKEASKLLAGNQAFDIELEDVNGKLAHLSDYKGKMIYVDFWATWCGPCMCEKPYFSRLKEKYNQPDLVFISISMDKEKERWVKCVEEEKSNAVEYLVKDINRVADDWQIKSIPRFLIIDKDFNIVNANAPVPSSGDAIESELNSQVN
ncbi:redoxin domain-containing protein [Labilibaculum sp. A4]|uniref:TlpA family protein disulfide reductase n=1 Tax=Labilibaculum euxinus TaxID=2686357 RepID=UPI000F6272E6|nr:TlpA disulfide reductase family protein [Labilibaculum euxinus]MDQ1770637.1 TlpA disulfide reductase family protein [Labilibaculum euxinus]MWN75143.1 redoxin domain-containing protein [Labilibaculum euxinus]